MMINAIQFDQPKYIISALEGIKSRYIRNRAIRMAIEILDRAFLLLEAQRLFQVSAEFVAEGYEEDDKNLILNALEEFKDYLHDHFNFEVYISAESKQKFSSNEEVLSVIDQIQKGSRFVYKDEMDVPFLLPDVDGEEVNLGSVNELLEQLKNEVKKNESKS